MRTVLRRLRSDEEGISLLMALGILVVLTIATVAMIQYTSSNLRSSRQSQVRLEGWNVAEAGLNSAATILFDSSANATDPTLLGCAAGAGGSSDCTNPALKCAAVTAQCMTQTSSNCQQQGQNGGNGCLVTVPGVAGTAIFYGFYNASASPVVYGDANAPPTTVPPASWLLISRGYRLDPASASTVGRTVVATSAVLTTTDLPANVAVWNHLYSTSPPGSGCEIDVTGTQVTIDVPVYVTGDMCLSGTQASVQEVAGGQPVDLHVEGKLVFAGSASKVGTDATRPITSGYVGGGCTTTINGSGHTCTAADRYYVSQTSSQQPLTPPVADGPAYYNSADPGPMHPCQAGGSPPPLAASTFDSNTTYGDSTATFDLTPNSSYRCISVSGESTGEIWWDNATKVLTVSGVVFFDGNIRVSQSLRYQHPAGVTGATIYAKTFTMTGTQTNICAVASCDFSSWNPNQVMLMIVTLGSGTTVSMSGTQAMFQGALFANPNATIALNGTQVQIQGPIVGGRFTWGTQTTLRPLPALTGLPPGAPLAYNAHATPQPLVFRGG